MDCYLACVPAAANCEVSVFNWATYSCKTGRKKAKVTKAPVPVLARVAIHNKTWPNVTTGELNKVEISHNYVLGASLCSPRELIMELLLFLEHFLPCNFMSTLIFANLFLFVRPVLCVDNSVYKRRTINHNFTWLCFTSFLVSLHGLLCYNTIIHKFYPASLKNTFIQQTYKKHTTNSSITKTKTKETEQNPLTLIYQLNCSHFLLKTIYHSFYSCCYPIPSVEGKLTQEQKSPQEPDSRNYHKH